MAESPPLDAATLRAVRERLQKAEGYGTEAAIAFDQFIELDIDPMLADAAQKTTGNISQLMSVPPSHPPDCHCETCNAHGATEPASSVMCLCGHDIEAHGDGLERQPCRECGCSKFTSARDLQTEIKLLSTIDASVWAKEWVRIAHEIEAAHDGRVVIDEGWMLSWFANAIMTGFDEGARRAKQETIEDLRPVVDDCHRVLDAAGIPRAERQTCDDSTCNSLLGHRVRDVVRRLQEATKENSEDIVQLVREKRDEVAALNAKIKELEQRESPLLQCLSCRNTESPAGAMARQFNHGRCLYCGGPFQVVRA